MQRLLLRLQKYDFAMPSIKGLLLTIADILSRASLKDSTPEISDEDLKCFVHTITSNYLISESRMKQFQEETLNDKTMQVLTRYIKSGWPLNRKHIPKEISPYYTYREELCMLDGLIMKALTSSLFLFAGFPLVLCGTKISPPAALKVFRIFLSEV